MMRQLVGVVLAALGVLALSPLLLLVAILVWWQDSRPILFAQERVGRHGVPFRLWKFRTMRSGAGGPLITASDDPRITPLGRFLRRSKLDELPQLINVLKGEMAVVGPRPEVARYVERYSPQQRRVLDVLPGITDPASLEFIDEERVLAASTDAERLYLHSIMPAKLRLNLAYAAHATVLSDLRVIVSTMIGLLGRYAAAGRGQDARRSANAR